MDYSVLVERRVATCHVARRTDVPVPATVRANPRKMWAGFGGRNDVDDIIETYARMSATATTEALLHFFRVPRYYR